LAEAAFMAKEGNSGLKNRELQAIVKKTSIQDLRNGVASYNVELKYYQAALKQCKSGMFKCIESHKCVSNKCVCLDRMKHDSKGNCIKKCQPGTKYDPKTKACLKRCKESETWVNNHCESNCTEGNTWDQKTKKCISVCAVGTKYDLKTKKCINVCQSDEDFTNGKCKNKCSESENYNATTKKCVSKCKAGTKWSAE